VSEGAAKLARAIAADFYLEDIERHYGDLLAYQKPELDAALVELIEGRECGQLSTPGH
jgi:hypothetical protein